MIDQGLLNGMQGATRWRDALDADHALPVERGQRHEAAIDGSELYAPVGIGPQQRYGARAAFTFGTALFASGAAAAPQPVEQRDVRVDLVDANRRAIEDEAHGHNDRV